MESRIPLYQVWKRMKNRCNNPKSEAYPNYGGRGIIECESWENDFTTFRDWALSNGYSPKLQIDRKENDGNYNPSNCRFVTRTENMSNRRNSRYITINGITKTVAQWSKEKGLDRHMIKSRLNRGWPEERLFEPSEGRGRPCK